MKFYIKYVADSYFEFIETSDDVEASTIPTDFLPLKLLDDGTSNPTDTDDLKYIKLIINDDVVYYKFYKECFEVSADNVRIIPLTDGNNFIFNSGYGNDALNLPTEILQTSALCFFGANIDTIFQEWEKNGFNEKYRQNVKGIIENAEKAPNIKSLTDALMDIRASKDEYERYKKESQDEYVNTLLQNITNKENEPLTLKTSEATEGNTDEATTTS